MFGHIKLLMKQDAFQILASKEIRLPSSRGSSDSAEIEEEGGGDGASGSAAKGRVITQAVKKGLIQNAVPIFIELKRLLESKNSPLIGSLMECLRALLKDYKNEIEEILIADKQLQKELIYDMQKYEATKAKSKIAEAAKETDPKNRLGQEMENDFRVASAMADAAAAATARSVLREVNQGAATPPLSAMGLPKLKSTVGRSSGRGERPMDVLESLRRRQTFNSDDEN